MHNNLLHQMAEQARVPEHSLPLMECVSGGCSFLVADYYFVGGNDWLMAIAYPLRGKYDHESFSEALEEALKRCNSASVDCWAIGPDLPPRLAPFCVDRDEFYTLPASAEPPENLKRHLDKARQVLRVEEGLVFTSEHRRLWAEFTGRKALKPQVRELFAATESAVNDPRTDLRLLNAWDQNEHLAACLLMDYGPQPFCSYLIGAHSRAHYAPYATDLLFETMLKSARATGKNFIHLGLGVNEGIRRFKLKWGATPHMPYVMASWKEKGGGVTEETETSTLVRLLIKGESEGLSKRQLHDSLPQQRPYAMLWELQKNGRRSWIGGTAHFFCYSFENSFRRLFKHVDTVIFEGPLDPVSLAEVEEFGRTVPQGYQTMHSLMTEAEITALEQVVRGPEGALPKFLNMEAQNKLDVRRVLRGTRVWNAFFRCWTAYLERNGWTQSVDLEAWHLAKDMGKTVFGMETIAEQIDSLESVQADRVLRYFRKCRNWKKFMQRNVRGYLAGDLTGMMGTSTEFPTRTDRIINCRDQRFRERMRPFIEAGRCMVFVGSAHMLNLRAMLEEDGFTVRRCLPTMRHRLAAWKNGEEGTASP